MITSAMKNRERSAEDALEYLSCTIPAAYAKGECIYGGGQAGSCLYVVLQGRVKVWRPGQNGAAMILGIYGPEQLFGETALIGGDPDEFATALERSQVMSWPINAIEEQIDKAPRLGLALMQTLVTRGVVLKDRIRDMASEKTPARVALALLALASVNAKQAPDGASCFPALTHQAISELVGTSREIVTGEMGKLRRMGLVNYSRKEIQVYAESLREYIQTRARLPQPPRVRRFQAMG